MKWSVLGLALIGVVAALCAAVLVTVLLGRGGQPTVKGPPPQSTIVKTSTAIPAMTVVSREMVATQNVPYNEAVGYMSTEQDVLGKVVSRPMVKGQAFRSDSLIPLGSGRELAAYLPTGKRAVAISLSDYSGIEGVLYPGSKVDVIASFDVPGTGRSETLSITLLPNVEVLGVGDRTIYSPPPSSDPNAPQRPQQGGKRMITLLVEEGQAQALTLAMEHGSISLALRNPLDTDPVTDNITILTELSKQRQYRRLLEQLNPKPPPPQPTSDSTTATQQAAPKAEAPKWIVTVLRAGAAEAQKFDAPKDKTPEHEDQQ